MAAGLWIVIVIGVLLVALLVGLGIWFYIRSRRRTPTTTNPNANGSAGTLTPGTNNAPVGGTTAPNSGTLPGSGTIVQAQGGYAPGPVVAAFAPPTTEDKQFRELSTSTKRTLNFGEGLVSQNGNYIAYVDQTGALGVYRVGTTTPVWQSSTIITGTPPYTLILGDSGNVTLQSQDKQQATIAGPINNGLATYPYTLSLDNGGSLAVYGNSSSGMKNMAWTKINPGIYQNRMDTQGITGPQRLYQGDKLLSPNGRFSFTLGTNTKTGALELQLYDGQTKFEPSPFGRGNTLFSLNLNLANNFKTKPGPPYYLEAQGDGNLVVYNVNRQPLAAIGSKGNGNYELVMQDDRNIVWYVKGTTKARWDSNTFL